MEFLFNDNILWIVGGVVALWFGWKWYSKKKVVK
jgi:uncharacterized membrane protein